MDDIIGKQIGIWKVCSVVGRDKDHRKLFHCVCAECGKEKDLVKQKIVAKKCTHILNQDKKSVYHREYIKKLRDERKKKGLCRECGLEDAWTINGHSYCFDCNAKRRKTEFNYIEEKEEEPKIKKEDWNKYGLCCKCGKNPIKEGIRPYVNVPYKICEKCFDDCMKAKEAYKKKYGPYGIRYIIPPYSKSYKAIATYRKLLEDQKERRKIFEEVQKQKGEVS